MIYLLPLGGIDQPVVDHLSARLLQRWHLAVKSLQAIAVPTNTFDRQRRQYNSRQIIAELKLFDFSNAERVLGVMAADIFSQNLRFVFGEAEAPGRNAVFSLCRLDPQFYGKAPSQTLVKERASKEAIHELGHTYGLSHCPEQTCVMFFSQAIKDVDRKTDALCPRCQKLYQMYNS